MSPKSFLFIAWVALLDPPLVTVTGFNSAFPASREAVAEGDKAKPLPQANTLVREAPAGFLQRA